MDSSFDICFPSYYQVPIDVIAGGGYFLSLHQVPNLYSWVDWNCTHIYAHTHTHTHIHTHTNRLHYIIIMES